MAIEIVDFPMKNGGSFHSYVAVYQRVWNPLGKSQCQLKDVFSNHVHPDVEMKYGAYHGGLMGFDGTFMGILNKHKLNI